MDIPKTKVDIFIHYIPFFNLYIQNLSQYIFFTEEKKGVYL